MDWVGWFEGFTLEDAFMKTYVLLQGWMKVYDLQFGRECYEGS